MLFTIASFLMPPLLVFGVYHLMTWFNAFRINERTYWRRVALASAVSHLLLVTGYLAFSYYDFQVHLRLDAAETAFGPYLFNQSEFVRLMKIFDTLPSLVIAAVFSIMNRAGINPPGLVIVTFAITYVFGTLQWFWVGGGIGALLEKFWAGLKTGDEEDEEWF
ncbi:MAG TPA: hypothetical protein VE422_22635 [Terriglobia bacterium]|nr:hypothetical protein [Terriglobia bacterium]